MAICKQLTFSALKAHNYILISLYNNIQVYLVICEVSITSSILVNNFCSQQESLRDENKQFHPLFYSNVVKNLSSFVAMFCKQINLCNM